MDHRAPAPCVSASVTAFAPQVLGLPDEEPHIRLSDRFLSLTNLSINSAASDGFLLRLQLIPHSLISRTVPAAETMLLCPGLSI